MPRLILGNFNKGLNIRDNPADLGVDELPWVFNFHISPKGTLYARSEHRLGMAVAAGAPVRCFYSSVLGQLLAQVGTTVYRFSVDSSTGVVSAETSLQVFSTSAYVSFADFNGVLVMVHPVDGVYTTTTGYVTTARSATVKGRCVAVWQNKVWVGGDSSNATRVWWSNAGDATTWTTASDFVDIRDVDDNSITALYSSGTMDIQGRGGLMVFKRDSHYRIYDSTTGAYTTLDSAAGAVGSQCVDAMDGLIAFLDVSGLHITDGLGKPKKVSGPVDPIFSGFALTTTTQDQSWVKAWRGRFLFHGRTTTTEQYWGEYTPEQGALGLLSHQKDVNVWVAPTSVARYPGLDELLFVDGSYSKIGWFASNKFSGQTRYDATLSMWVSLQTPWIAFDSFAQVRVHRMLLLGRTGTADLDWEIFKDWNNATSASVDRTQFELTSTADTVGTITDQRDLGVCRSMSLILRGSLSGETVPSLNYYSTLDIETALDSGTAASRGRATISGLVFDFERLDGL